MTEREKKLKKALEKSNQALEDWIQSYASEFCDEKRVLKTRQRILGSGGTLAYISNIRAENQSILNELE